ncbi:GNAT family N-acetyltransferase [Stenotrophomonas sp. HITSZ_GD]|uniref:GNAT family N-acetyltransferase n=1 Tax=Stenotrophomonas sp. HITSZ_GD TaxID=3037248 RepID=UPI00240E8DCC|nr:GNAT family N-acetyltransferase [Stenotrophomonas sp. HITSZ_GD]MDG2524083.1 GNAT family N-acetyltransferase [Stenotrophomonas sp. HITSZ_GD]
MEIRPGDLDHPAVIGLLEAHLRDMQAITPAESVHALDLSGLRAGDVRFWSAWIGEEAVGCGALRDLGQGHGELKSMRTSNAHRNQGVGSAMLAHLLATARAGGYRQLWLETGASAPFFPAHRLYERAGFTACGPFGDYTDDPHSVFMTLRL